MASEHRLIEYESDFLEDGYYAICSCGWKSLNAPTTTAAAELHADHATLAAVRAKEK